MAAQSGAVGRLTVIVVVAAVAEGQEADRAWLAGAGDERERQYRQAGAQPMAGQ
ncbi:MAG: hypothetical protein ACREVI_05415 [Steroidobacteraceae bacterium]